MLIKYDKNPQQLWSPDEIHIKTNNLIKKEKEIDTQEKPI